MPFTQRFNGHLAFGSPLGEDVLLLTQLRGQEGISRLFQFDLELLSEKPALDFSTIVGKNVTIRINQPDHTDRFFNGIVSRFSQSGGTATFTSYHAEVVPWLWLLTRTADCKIFQMMTVAEIIQAVFSNRGFQDVRFNLSKSYPKKDYCVQYRETDFNFVSRLMEHNGLFYYFDHATKGKHTLIVLADCERGASRRVRPAVRYQTTLGATRTDEDVVTGWTQEQEMRSAKYSLMDFNFETPRVALKVQRDPAHPLLAGQKLEMFDYPGEYTKVDAGEQIVRLRTEEEEAQRIAAKGTGTSRHFTSGYRFDLKEHPRSDMNTSYVLMAVTHAATEASYLSGADGDVANYSNSFSCQPASIAMRSARVTPRPTIHGLQTAIVVGKSGEELLVDKYGRIKVQFHWDRQGKYDENSSCWIRVSQNWAGRRWGAVFLPRVGQEVLVEFLEGDPDQPMVTGSLYNGDQNPPYDLPGEQTKATIKSNSSKGGGGFNELRFEDKKDSEQIYLHGQKDLDIVIEKDRREQVKGDRHQIVKGKRVTSVDGDEHLKVGSNRVIEVGSALSEKAQTIYLKGDTSVVIEAGLELTLKGGGGFVKVDPSGVTISGPIVRINSGGAAGSGSANSVKTPDEPKP